MFNKLRFWIIKKLAGDSPIIMNVSFSAEKIRTNGKEALIYQCEISTLKECEQ